MVSARLTLSKPAAFIGLSYCFWAVMVGTTLPTPLYGIYQARLGFSNLVLTALFAVYAVGVLAALLLWGPVSDQIGRRAALAPGLVASAVSGVVFLLAGTLSPLFIGRVLSGLSAGVFTGTATAALLDLAGDEGRGRATLVATAVNVGGLGTGPLLAGVLAQLTGSPLRSPYWVQLGLLAPGAVAVALMPETVTHRSAPRLRLQPLRVPEEARAVFVQGALAGFAGFAVFGLFSAVASSFLAHTLHESSHALAGAVVFAVFSAAAVGQLALGVLGDHRSLLTGCLALAGGMVMVALALVVQSLALLVAGAIIAGLGQGLSFRAGLAAVNARVPANVRGEVTSSFFIVCYVAISVPVVGVGVLADVADLRTAGIVFSAVVVAIALTAFALLARRDASGR